MLRPQFIFFYLRWAHKRKYSFLVRSTSICLSSFLMHRTFTIINNLLFSLQNKFPFVFFFFFFLWNEVNGSTIPHTDMRHAGPAVLQILHYFSSSWCSILHYYHDLTVALLIFAFHNFHFFSPTFDSCERLNGIIHLYFGGSIERVNATCCIDCGKNQKPAHRKTSNDVQNAFSGLMDWWLSRNWKPKRRSNAITHKSTQRLYEQQQQNIFINRITQWGSVDELRWMRGATHQYFNFISTSNQSRRTQW